MTPADWQAGKQVRLWGLELTLSRGVQGRRIAAPRRVQGGRAAVTRMEEGSWKQQAPVWT